MADQQPGNLGKRSRACCQTKKGRRRKAYATALSVLLQYRLGPSAPRFARRCWSLGARVAFQRALDAFRKSVIHWKPYLLLKYMKYI
jgi:hypothetical protein